MAVGRRLTNGQKYRRERVKCLSMFIFPRYPSRVHLSLDSINEGQFDLEDNKRQILSKVITMYAIRMCGRR